MGSNFQFLGGLLLLHIWVASSSADPARSRPDDQTPAYLRFADVECHCKPVLSSAAGLPDDAHRASRVMRELPFEKGDWRQDAGHALLMPFDGSDVPSSARSRLLKPLPLATFVITHFDDENRARTAVNVSGVLVLSISRKNRDAEIRLGAPVESSSPEFKLSPGATKLKITFEGVYVERDGGERLLCMVGSAVLPTRSAGGSDPWDWAKNSGRSGFLPPVTAVDDILLLLLYPKELALTTRAVLGEMRSTSVASSAAYFDPVQLVSQLRWSPYQYRSDDLVAGTCSPLPSIDADDVADGRARHRYKGNFFCFALERYGYGRDAVFAALPNRRCDSTAAGASGCPSLGPFKVGRAADEDDIARSRIVMLIQDLRCYTDTAGTVRVSVVLRAVPPWEELSTAAQRSGMSGATVFAEGVWVASAGQACLAACRGTGSVACDLRVCLYMPMTFSITGRSVLVGRITRINTAATTGEVAEVSALSFSMGLSLPKFWLTDGEQLAFSYNYTKVERAVELLRRSEPPSTFRKIIAKSLSLSYPRADHYADDDRRSLAHLADMLVLRFTTIPSMFTQDWSWIEQTVLQLDIIFLGQVSDRFTRASAPRLDREGSGKLLVNVSAELSLISHGRHTTSVMSLEGVYSPVDGRMFLAGCRDLRWLQWRNSSASRDLDLKEGMDCSIEVEVQYPPWNTHWLIWWAAKVQIASTRKTCDPLHFDRMKLQAVPSQFPQAWRGKLDAGLANGVLCIVSLSTIVAAELSQLRHLGTHAGAASYVSLVMLGVQGLGFGAPVVFGINALRAKVTLGSEMADYALVVGRLYRSMDKAVKVLSLAALVLTLRLGQKVWLSRTRVLCRSSSSPRARGRVPGDAKVFVYHSAVHLALFVLILGLNGEAMTVEKHVELVQNLFLLPQMIGNAVWRVNCKPLAEGYYLGVTAARMLPRVDDCVRPHVLVGYSLEPSNASRFVHSSIVMPPVSILLGLVVYVQQQWNYAVVTRMGMAGKRRLQRVS